MARIVPILSFLFAASLATAAEEAKPTAAAKPKPQVSIDDVRAFTAVFNIVRQAYVEPVDHIAEAALALVSAEPKDLTGKIAFSWMYLDEIGRTTMSLDGKSVITKRGA